MLDGVTSSFMEMLGYVAMQLSTRLLTRSGNVSKTGSRQTRDKAMSEAYWPTWKRGCVSRAKG